jgi:hypothetical protein
VPELVLHGAARRGDAPIPLGRQVVHCVDFPLLLLLLLLLLRKGPYRTSSAAAFVAIVLRHHLLHALR